MTYCALFFKNGDKERERNERWGKRKRERGNTYENRNRLFSFWHEWMTVFTHFYTFLFNIFYYSSSFFFETGDENIFSVLNTASEREAIPRNVACNVICTWDDFEGKREKDEVEKRRFMVLWFFPPEQKLDILLCVCFLGVIGDATIIKWMFLCGSSVFRG